MMLEKLQQLLDDAKLLKVKSEKYMEGRIDAIHEVMEIWNRNTYGGTKQSNKEPRQPISELIELQESEVRPAAMFLDEPAEILLDKIVEEFGEVMDAAGEYLSTGDGTHLAEEIVDLQMSCETALAKIRPDVHERRAIRKSVIVKNTNRRYYGETKKS